MKKTIATLAITAILGLTGLQIAQAGPGYGWGGGPGYGMMGPGYGATQVDPEKQEQFFKDTEALRKEMATLRGEYAAVMQGETPDAAKAGELEAKMFDLREKMRSKAEAAGMGPGNGRGRGYGMGPGYGRGGYGMGPGYGGGYGPGNCPNRGW